MQLHRLYVCTFLCRKATVCLVNSNRGNWWRGYLWERARLLTDLEELVLQPATNNVQWPPSVSFINRDTQTHGLKAHGRELSFCITVPAADKSEPRALGIVVLWYNSFNLLHRRYSHNVIQPTLLATVWNTQMCTYTGLKGFYSCRTLTRLFSPPTPNCP